MLTIVCTTKPNDGLFYYSNEYCQALRDAGEEVNVMVIPYPGYSEDNYVQSALAKYVDPDINFFDYDNIGDTILIMGRSVLTLAYINIKHYNDEHLFMLKVLFAGRIISVYSENHPIRYYDALKYFNPCEVIDLCDHEVYPNGVGEHFEKTINFTNHKPIIDNVQYEHLFLGTNDKYYSTIESHIDQYPNSCILVYPNQEINNKHDHIFAPVKNLLGIFNKYVYTKATFDPAPRIFQECKYLNKEIIYARDKSIVDGGSVYIKRDIKDPDIEPILKNL